MRQVKLIAGALGTLAAMALLLCAGGAAAQGTGGSEARKPPPDLVMRGDAKCTRCHDAEDSPELLQIGKTRHGMNADQRTPTCTSCHGESDNHINKPADATVRPKPDRVFKRNNDTTSPQEQNAVCLTCHQGGNRIHFQGSAHERAQLACASCHTVHAPRDQVLVKATQAGVCFTCHKDKRADIFRFSTHPLRTGWMACSSCHQPHGSVGEFNLIKNTINETCYTCHADKRGPFLWEHPPARENCAVCHNPHGSNNSYMLAARGPYLCQQCHIAQFHPSTLYDGNRLPGGTNPDFSRIAGQNCANCHPKVHGSNHPSGARFTR
jgi:DmsE family decaheme c-type cytochrome